MDKLDITIEDLQNVMQELSMEITNLKIENMALKRVLSQIDKNEVSENE